MSNVAILPFPVSTLTNAIKELALNEGGPNHIDRHPVDDVILWAMTYESPTVPAPVLYDQDAPRNAGEFDPEIEALLREEEAIERSVRANHETPTYRPYGGPARHPLDMD